MGIILTFSKFAVIVLAAFGFSIASTVAQEKPNVLLIIIDDLNDWVGCLGGHPDAKTPNIDALSRRGTLFTNAHCQAPICGPSRASLLTGRYPSSTGLYVQPGKSLSQDRERFIGHLLPQHFSNHGYQTYGVGKVTHGIELSSVVDIAGPTGNSGPKPKGPKQPNDVRFHYRPDYSIPYTGTQTDWGAFPERDEQMPDHTTAAWAVEHLQKKVGNQGKPFFMAVGFHRPHVPFYVPQKWFDPFSIDSITLPEIVEEDLDDLPTIARELHELPRYPQWPFLRANDDLQWRRCVQAYLACTTFVDAQIGKVLKVVPPNTVIALVSDHGYHLGEKNRVSKHSLWPESTRVPMIIVPPSEGKVQTIDQPVGLIDLFPTLCSLANIPSKSEIDGLDLSPILANPHETWPRMAIRTTYARGNHSLRSKTHHYIRYEDGSEELYDLREDPNAWKNLAPTASEDQLAPFRKRLPKSEASYHPSNQRSPVNAWFERHLERHHPANN